MKEIKQQLLRAKNIPELKVKHPQLSEDVIESKEFNEKVIMSYIKTGARINENIVEFPIWDDQNEFGTLIPPWGFHKFCNYKKEDFGLGLVHIQFNFGKKCRKQNDFRFRDEKDVEIYHYYFLFDFDKRHYIEIQPEKNKEWQKRMTDMDHIEKKTYSFLREYLINKRPHFASFKKRLSNTNKTYKDIKMELNEIDIFLDDTWLYIDLLLIIYGDINSGEHFYLEQTIRHLKRQINECLDYISSFNPSHSYDAYQDYFDRTNRESGLGVISSTYFKLEEHFTSRREKISDDDWFAYNLSTGYIKVKNEILFPNLAEIERRRSLYVQGGNYESEEEIKSEILRRLK